MRVQGIGIGQGVATGPVVRMADRLPDPPAVPSRLSAQEESARAEQALADVADALERHAAATDGTAKDVLDAQALMARDPALAAEIANRLARGRTAERAVFEGFETFRSALAAAGGYFADRVIDLDDVSHRIIARLQGVEAAGVPDPDHPFVLVARTLAPADTATLDLAKVLAVVTEEGGRTSHTAILAAEKAIVAVVGAAGAMQIDDGTEVVVDAENGLVIASPSEAERATALRRAHELAVAAAAPIGPGRLADGTAIPLLANLGSAEGAAAAVAAGAEGVGLLRTEFLFGDTEAAPSVEEQREKYAYVLAAFPGKKVIVRMLDAGSDKPLSYLGVADEENPALGERGIRALRRARPVLDDQLRALAQAAANTSAELWVMAPMVATIEEARWFTQYAHRMGLERVGVMVEVPSAALLADRLLGETDFASIGTNDLTQYTLAADRTLGTLAELQDPWHPAVLKLIALIGEAGRSTRRPVGVCGEAAADPLLAVVLVGLGVTSLSMSAPALGRVRRYLARFTLEQAQTLARAALAGEGGAEASRRVRELAARLGSLTAAPGL
ncbi:phosphoenolpyruvate--protein phosphotransferase [Rathayibacter sp. YIM 133350]|uniref:phosphoenolpyruvate--protein phosphotransferase n=1 Tax=Rathayibacter sp. YIM 133350 TaxID=3131992 RepID=UPI00307FC043